MTPAGTVVVPPLGGPGLQDGPGDNADGDNAHKDKKDKGKKVKEEKGKFQNSVQPFAPNNAI